MADYAPNVQKILAGWPPGMARRFETAVADGLAYDLLQERFGISQREISAVIEHLRPDLIRASKRPRGARLAEASYSTHYDSGMDAPQHY